PSEHNWDHLPPGHRHPLATPYADYLIPIFDDWWQEDDSKITIRIFRDILTLIFGGKVHVDSLGGSPVTEAVIETDGSLEPMDVLRSCSNGLTQVGLNVLRDPIDALYLQPLFKMAMSGQSGLCKFCSECSLGEICGGGYLPHRFSKARGFDNPSVYCRDLWKLI